MDAETKKTAVGNGILAAGVVVAAGVFAFLNNTDQPPVETINEAAIVERVTSEARKDLEADKKTMVVTPDKVHADVMLWLNEYEQKAQAANAAQDERVNKLAEIADKLTTQQDEMKNAKDPNQAKLITTLETLATKVTNLDSKNNELSLAVDAINRRMTFNEKAMTDDLTRVFEGFDGRIRSLQARPTDVPPQPIRREIGEHPIRLVSDAVEVQPSPEAVEENRRLARIEEILAAQFTDKSEANPEGISVDWGDNKPKVQPERPANDHPAPPTAKPKQKGLVRSLAGETSGTIHEGTDVAVDTVNKATGVAGQLVKDLTDTAGRALGGASDTAGSAIGGASDIAKHRGKSAWSKFW